MSNSRLRATIWPLWPAATTFLALVVYLSTLAPDLTWANFGADGGELITASYTLGVPHPPGYPTYVLLGRLFSFLPWGTVAYRYNLFSAVCVALAAAFVTAAAGHPTAPVRPAASRLLALSAGLTFAFAPLVWGQALIAEVYGLNLLALALFLWALLTGRPPAWAGFFLGLAVTTHLTSLLMFPLLLYWRVRSHWRWLALGFLAGLLPLLALPWLGRGDSPVVWGRPETLDGWLWLVTGRLYGPNVLATTLAEAAARFPVWVLALLAQFAWIGLPLLPLSLKLVRGRAIRLALPLVASLYFLYSITYSNQDAIILLLPAILLLALLWPAAWLLAAEWLLPVRSQPAAPALALALPLALLALNYPSLDIRAPAEIRSNVAGLWRALPESAIVLTPGDQTINALWYFQHVEGQRPDLILVDANLLAFDWYRQRLARHYPALVGLDVDDVKRFARLNRPVRPVCSASLVSPAAHPCLMAVSP